MEDFISQGIDLEPSLGNIDLKGSIWLLRELSLMSSDLKELVKSWKVKGNREDLLLVVKPGPRRLDGVTDLEGWCNINRQEKTKDTLTVPFPSSLL